MLFLDDFEGNATISVAIKFDSTVSADDTGTHADRNVIHADRRVIHNKLSISVSVAIKSGSTVSAVCFTAVGVVFSCSSAVLEMPEEYISQWDELVSTQLAEINKKNTADLVGGHPLNSSSGSDSDSDFKDILFPRDDSMQQVMAAPYCYQ